MEVTKPYKFIGFGAMEVTKPYKFIGFGAMEVTKPYEFIGFGAMEVTKPYKFIGFGARHWGRAGGIAPGTPAAAWPSGLGRSPLGPRSRYGSIGAPNPMNS